MQHWLACLLWWDDLHLHFETEDGWEIEPLRVDIPASLPLTYGNWYNVSCWTDADGDHVSVEPMPPRIYTEADLEMVDQLIVELEAEIARLEIELPTESD